MHPRERPAHDLLKTDRMDTGLSMVQHLHTARREREYTRASPVRCVSTPWPVDPSHSHFMLLKEPDPSHWVLKYRKLGVCMRVIGSCASRRTKEYTLSWEQRKIFPHKAISPAQTEY